MLGAQQIHLVVCLGASGADLQHRTHGGVAVDVGVVTLHVTDAGIDVGDLINSLHQGGVCFPGTGTVGTVQNISLCRGAEAVIHQLALHRVLNQLDIRGAAYGAALQIPLDIIGNPGGIVCVAVVGSFQRPQNGGGDLVLVIQHNAAVTLGNTLDHNRKPFFHSVGTAVVPVDITQYIVFSFLFLHNILP